MPGNVSSPVMLWLGALAQVLGHLVPDGPHGPHAGGCGRGHAGQQGQHEAFAPQKIPDVFHTFCFSFGLTCVRVCL